MSYRVKILISLGVFLCFVAGLLLSDGFSINYIESFSNQEKAKPIIIIDAGHGGVDPGAVKGDIYEKNINLSIALKLRDFCLAFGLETVMIRTEDISVHDKSATTLRSKKQSDLKNRVKTVNSYENTVLISIHQNMYEEEKYYGTQVFYGTGDNSKLLALLLQDTVIEYLQNQNTRKVKNGTNLYILENSQAPSVMVECGFMSNQEELKKLTDEEYQINFAYALSVGILKYIGENGNGREA